MQQSLVLVCCILCQPSLPTPVEVRFVQFDPEIQEVIVQAGDREVSYKLADPLKVVLVIEPEGTTREATRAVAIKIFSSEQFKGKQMQIIVDQNTITEVKLRVKRVK